MKAIDPQNVHDKLAAFTGKEVYIHCEVTPGGFMRNVRVHVIKAQLSGEGPFRAALKLAGSGWIRVEGLTDYVIDDQNRLLLAGHDGTGRLTTALEISMSPFPE